MSLEQFPLITVDPKLDQHSISIRKFSDDIGKLAFFKSHDRMLAGTIIDIRTTPGHDAYELNISEPGFSYFVVLSPTGKFYRWPTWRIKT